MKKNNTNGSNITNNKCIMESGIILKSLSTETLEVTVDEKY